MNEENKENEKSTEKGVLTVELDYKKLDIIVDIILIASFLVVIYTVSSLNSKIESISSELSSIKKEISNLGSRQAQQLQPTQPTGNSQPTKTGPTISLTGKIPRGNVSAPITIVEYSDFQCPFCKRVQPTLDQLLKDYNGKIKLYYKHFPLNQIHPYAQKAAEASECAADQGKFWEYHDKLFENQNALDIQSLKKYAAELGLDTNKFNSCLDNGDKASQVNTELQEGISNGVSGTPTFFINGIELVGAQPYDAFKQIIDSELRKIG
jgi:protein-disulfide isomerase